MNFLRDIEDSLLLLLNDEMSVPVIIDYSNGPEPKNDYGVLGLTINEPLHRSSVRSEPTAIGLEEVIRQDFLLRFTIRFYGDTCYDNAFLSQAVLKSRAIQDYLYGNAHISYAGAESIRRFPEPRKTGYIQRALYDIKFLAGYEYKRTVDWFNTVSYESEYTDPNGDVAYSGSRTVSTS